VALPGIEPVAAVRRSDDVAEQIRNLIIREDLAKGARLPAERTWPLGSGPADRRSARRCGRSR